ncbi:NmrA family protein [Cellulomonas flavigena DSM 20109]|uniref:NmrA family protein n=1 Tax=Cellulomonas flavigena (strain ATCC 482 / DSM 20109 / BCRC 11376 / JCM 18109 / NBRC 3775 / NCIMB 8073 / NRS 134) TaxID=446466 RepID=D5UCM7_CELFN|nr:NAD(P)H-binding protein [Cellulomonas flavigena]ADG76262.1 NmrA family protein [Cellulomonas flavigena DSM 20109]
MSRTVLVTGARGKTGREVVSQLVGRGGAEVRGGSSRPPQAPTTVRFDWHDPSTWPAAVDGVDAIYLARPDVQDAPGLVERLVAAAPDAHVVLLSEQGAERVAPDGWVRQVEDAVTGNARRWTILRPSWFQQVLTDPRYFLEAIRQGRTISLPTDGAPIAWVDTRDIAAVAVQAIADPASHHGLAHTITGPQAVTTSRIAAEISAATGIEVTAHVPALSQALPDDPWLAGVLEEMFGRVHDGTFADVTDTVERVTGRTPRTIEAFVAEHAALWR